MTGQIQRGAAVMKGLNPSIRSRSNIGPKQQQKLNGHHWTSSSLIVYYPIDFFLILALHIKIIKSKQIPPGACGHRCVYRLVLPRDCKGVVWLELLAGQNVGKPSPGVDVQLTGDSEGAQLENHSNKHKLRWQWKCWEHWKPLAPNIKKFACKGWTKIPTWLRGEIIGATMWLKTIWFYNHQLRTKMALHGNQLLQETCNPLIKKKRWERKQEIFCKKATLKN